MKLLNDDEMDEICSWLEDLRKRKGVYSPAKDSKTPKQTTKGRKTSIADAAPKRKGA